MIKEKDIYNYIKKLVEMSASVTNESVAKMFRLFKRLVMDMIECYEDA